MHSCLPDEKEGPFYRKKGKVSDELSPKGGSRKDTCTVSVESQEGHLSLAESQAARWEREKERKNERNPRRI